MIVNLRFHYTLHVSSKQNIFTDSAFMREGLQTFYLRSQNDYNYNPDNLRLAIVSLSFYIIERYVSLRLIVGGCYLHI